MENDGKLLILMAFCILLNALVSVLIFMHFRTEMLAVEKLLGF